MYRATVQRHDRNTVDCYTGLTGDRFKDRYSKHMSDIRLGRSTKSKLSSHVCRLKENNIPYDISWEIVTKAPQYNPSSRVCRLCILEAYHLIFTPGGGQPQQEGRAFWFLQTHVENFIEERRNLERI